MSRDIISYQQKIRIQYNKNIYSFNIVIIVEINLNIEQNNKKSLTTDRCDL